MNDELLEPTVEFLIDFGPIINIPVSAVLGEDVGARVENDMNARINFPADFLGTDNMELLVRTVKGNARFILDDVADYIRTDEFKNIFENAMLQAIATYRGTVLRKGIPNRETRRQNGERGALG